MWIKIVTVKIKKHKYQYVKVMDRQYTGKDWVKKEIVVATLGTVTDVNSSIDKLIEGLQKIKDA